MYEGNGFMKFLEKKLLGCPLYGYLTAVLLYALQNLLYEQIRMYQERVGVVWHTTKIPLLDDLIPLQPEFWIIIYLFSHIFWIIGPIAASKVDKAHYRDFIAGVVIAELIGAAVFVLYPTGMNRAAEGLLNNNPGFFNGILQWTYAADGLTYGTNLLPSFHCLISTSYFLVVYKRPEISRGYQIFAGIFCILIFISTVTTKQHFIIDIPAGIALAVFSYALACHFHLGNLGRGEKASS